MYGTSDFWQILDESGVTLIDYSSSSFYSCYTMYFNYNASSSQIKQWSSDGLITFQVIANGFNSNNNIYCGVNDYFCASIESSSYDGVSNVVSGNTLNGTLLISDYQTVGWYDVKVFDNNINSWIHIDSAFYVDFPPVIDSIFPSFGIQNQNVDVNISSSNIFYQSSSNVLSNYYLTKDMKVQRDYDYNFSTSEYFYGFGSPTTIQFEIFAPQMSIGDYFELK